VYANAFGGSLSRCHHFDVRGSAAPCETWATPQSELRMAGIMAEPQSFTNHTRRDPKYLVFAPLAMICFIMSVVHVIHDHSRANILLVPVTFLVVGAIVMTRMYALQNQNRIIRLEESLRIMTLGGSAAGVTPAQFIALRFASDEEVVTLARRAVAENMEPKAIKAAIKNWRADNDRI
jgi:hypothetical protein